MTPEVTWLAALLVGLLGSTHCLGMCGGIAGALAMGLPGSTRRSPARTASFLLAYNLGRIASYAAAGAVVGMAGYLAVGAMGALPGLKLLRVVAGLFMVALGLYLAGWWRGLAVLERGGARLWRRIQPLTRRLMPVRSLPAALVLGGLWGWLPCGLVYSALAWSAAAGGPLEGALLMAGFGVGTLPALLLAGGAAGAWGALTRDHRVRAVSGGLIILFGVWTLIGVSGLLPHGGAMATHG